AAVGRGRQPLGLHGRRSALDLRRRAAARRMDDRPSVRGREHERLVRRRDRASRPDGTGDGGGTRRAHGIRGAERGRGRDVRAADDWRARPHRRRFFAERQPRAPHGRAQAVQTDVARRRDHMVRAVPAVTTPPRALARPALGWRVRLQTQVAVAVTLVVAFALGAAMIIATRVVTSGSLDRAAAELEAARSAFYRLQDDREEFAAAQATLVTQLPVFRAHLTDSRLANDVATVQVLADEYRQQLASA